MSDGGRPLPYRIIGIVYENFSAMINAFPAPHAHEALAWYPAYNAENTMLAAVVRVNIWTGTFQISLQRYKPGSRIGDWGKA